MPQSSQGRIAAQPCHHFVLFFSLSGTDRLHFIVASLAKEAELQMAPRPPRKSCTARVVAATAVLLLMVASQLLFARNVANPANPPRPVRIKLLQRTSGAAVGGANSSLAGSGIGGASLPSLWSDADRVMLVAEPPEAPTDAALERQALELLRQRDEVKDSELSSGAGSNDSNGTDVSGSDGSSDLSAPRSVCGDAGMRVLSAPQNELWARHNPTSNPSFFDYALNKPVFVYEVCVHSEADAVSSYFIAHGRSADCQYVPDLLAIGSQAQPEKGGKGLYVDVGANIGVCAIEAAALGYRVIALEAEPRSFALLQDSARLNSLDGRLVVVNAAAWDSDGWRRIFVEDGNFAHAIVPDDASGASLQLSSEWSNATFQVDVIRAVTLDTVVNETVALLNIDVHGSELRVLRGARTLMRRHGVLCLRIAFSPLLVAVVGDSPLELLVELHNLGFDLFVMDWGHARSSAASAWLQPSLFAAFVEHLQREGFSTHINATRSDDWDKRPAINVSALGATVGSTPRSWVDFAGEWKDYLLKKWAADE